MSVMGIVIAAAIVGGTGLFIGIFLGLAGHKLAIQTDPREEEVLEALPGNNCGGCGFPGCSGLAAAIVKGEAPVSGCPVGGAPVAEAIAKIMGQDAGEQVRMVAFVKCGGTCELARNAYDYRGVEDCSMMAGMQADGPKACGYGCYGYGDCVRACPFDAIHIVDGISQVDHEACKACGKCVDACPRHLIEMIPYDQRIRVQCASLDPGKLVTSVCQVGCIACRICEKTCQFDAIHVTDNVAKIDYTKCTNCGACAVKCPRKIIRILGQEPELPKQAAKAGAKERTA